MRTFLLGLVFILAACAAPQEPSKPIADQPHLPPPEMTVSEAQSCGGMVAGAPDCGDGQYCHRDIADACGAADAPGVCRVKPKICTREFAPVCGCDGKTYPTACVANSNGVSAASLGDCAAEPIACTLEYMPVCGEDGKTYGNACMAGTRPVAYEGECQK